jgi:hypothetical protein
MKEPASQDKIHLLMEETGCDPGEAELALASAGYDVEKAVRTIAGLLRHIVALKAKFQVPSRSLYGLVVLIADLRRPRVLRIRAVVSYNPSMFETVLEQDWYDVERALYGFRLGEGALQQVSQDLERVLGERWANSGEGGFYEWLREGRTNLVLESLERLVSSHFSGEAVTLRLAREELNLDQYHRVRREEDPFSRPASPPAGGTGENLALKVSLEEDEGGVPAKEISPGDVVRALLTDERDIAQYVSKLLGGRSAEGLKSLPAPVEGVTADGEELRIQIRLSGTILGLAQARKDCRLKVDHREGDPWWRRFLLGRR